MTTARESIDEKAMIVREWIVERSKIRVPNEDEVWEYVTSRWRTIGTESAEQVLNRAMAHIPLYHAPKSAPVDLFGVLKNFVDENGNIPGDKLGVVARALSDKVKGSI